MHQSRRIQAFVDTHKSSPEGLWRKEDSTETKYRGMNQEVLALRGRTLTQDSREPGGQKQCKERFALDSVRRFLKSFMRGRKAIKLMHERKRRDTSIAGNAKTRHSIRKIAHPAQIMLRESLKIRGRFATLLRQRV